MFLLVGGVIVLVVSNVLGEYQNVLPVLPNTYKDIFLAGSNTKKTLGTTSSTCWARGGVCVDIKNCPGLQIDTSVAGCTWGYKVCCKNHKMGTPTTGVLRRYTKIVTNDLVELGPSVEVIAQRNTKLLASWRRPNIPESDEIHLEDLMNK